MNHREWGRLGASIFWKKFREDKNFRESIKKKWQIAAAKRIKGEINTELTHKEFSLLKSRICGYLAGDGGVYIRKQKNSPIVHYEIKFAPNTHKVAKIFQKAFSRLYKIRMPIRNLGNYYILRVKSKVAVFDLLKTSRFGTKKWRVPFRIIKSKRNKIEWMKAFFDSEGSVGKRSIQIQSVNKIGIKQVQKLLKSLGINSKVYSYKREQKNWSINYILCINRKEDRFKFIKLVNSNNPNKREKMQKMLRAGMAEPGNAPEFKAKLE